MIFTYSVVGGATMNQEVLYSMFATTLSKMDDQELKESLEKAKSLLSASDYEKLTAFIEEEKKKHS